MKQFLNSKVKDSKRTLFMVFPLLIFVGKLVRWTLMKTVLVDKSVGLEIIEALVNYGSVKRTTADVTVPFYRLINVFGITSFAGYEIYLSILLNVILLVIFYKVNRQLSVTEFTFYSLSVIVLNIFDFTLAKEPVQFLYFLAVYVILVTFKKEVWVYICSAAVFIICAVYFRSYYYLVVLYFAILVGFFAWCRKKQLKNGRILITAFVGFTLFYLMILVATRFASYDTYKQLIRVRTRENDAKTAIIAIFGSDNLILFSLNYFITLIRMLFPIELLRFGPKYFMYVLYQLFITYFLIGGIRKASSLDRKQYIALLLCIAFVLCSATFEPDFGSWIRHEALLLPIILVLQNAVKTKPLEEKKEVKSHGKTRFGHYTDIQGV